MTSKGDILQLNLYLYIIIYRNMKPIKEAVQSYFNFRYKEHLEMLIILYIRLFLISYDIGGMSLGDSEINYYFFW